MYGNYNNPYMSIPQQYYQARPQPMQVQGLQGKSVDSLEAVKAADIAFDGTISYFPFVDNSMIATKQLQQDGTSKIVIYKPIEVGGEANIKYVTPDELNNALKGINEKELKELKDEIKSLKKQIRNLEED